jgi:hypothetical protein
VAPADTSLDMISPLRSDVQDRIERAGARAARYHDRHRQPAPDLQPGDMVFVKGTRMGANAARLAELGATTRRRKALPQWVGPFPVSHRISTVQTSTLSHSLQVSVCQTASTSKT